jgi:hypothetical protein
MGDTDLETLRKLAGMRDEKQMTAENQLNRLLGKVWRNPYDVLLLDMGASDEEIKKKYKMVGPVSSVHNYTSSRQVF